MGIHLILTGFMGAGKTTVGKALSSLMSRPLLDTDQLIEAQAGMSVSRIFEVWGEEEFRRLETETIRTILDRKEAVVLSVGGGLPLRQAGQVVYLRVKPQTVLTRLKGDTTRPLLQGGDVEEKVRNLLTLRGPVYEEGAHLIVDVDGKTPQQIGEEILCKKRLKI